METREFNNGTYEEVSNHFIEAKKKDKFILKLNLYAILFIIVLAIPTLLLFGSFNIVIDGFESLVPAFLYMIAFLVFVVIHELLHGISFILFGKVKIKEVKFGLVLKSGMAYCISTVPVPIKAARISLMMPVYAVCIPLYIVGILLNSVGLALLAIFFLSGSIADFYYMWISRKVEKELYMFEEMPVESGYEIGYRIYRKVK